MGSEDENVPPMGWGGGGGPGVGLAKLMVMARYAGPGLPRRSPTTLRVK